MTEITLTLTGRERTRLWHLLIDAADKAQGDVEEARTDEECDVCELDVELFLRVAELLSTQAPSGDAA